MYKFKTSHEEILMRWLFYLHAFIFHSSHKNDFEMLSRDHFLIQRVFEKGFQILNYKSEMHPFSNAEKFASNF